MSLVNDYPFGFILSPFLFISSAILWSFSVLFSITVFDLICLWDAMCFITELFVLDTASLQASHLSLPDITVRCSPLNWFNLSQALTFRSAVPQTFRVFSAEFVCTLCSLEISAFAGVLRLPPPSAATSKDLNDLPRLRHLNQYRPPFWIYFL